MTEDNRYPDTCPSCGSDAWKGATKIHCASPTCEHAEKPRVSVPPDDDKLHQELWRRNSGAPLEASGEPEEKHPDWRELGEKKLKIWAASLEKRAEELKKIDIAQRELQLKLEAKELAQRDHGYLGWLETLRQRGVDDMTVSPDVFDRIRCDGVLASRRGPLHPKFDEAPLHFLVHTAFGELLIRRGPRKLELPF